MYSSHETVINFNTCLIDLSEELKCTLGKQVIFTGPQTLRKAKGDNVTLGRRCTTSPSDTGELDIEWSVVSQHGTIHSPHHLSLLCYNCNVVYK